MTDNRPLLPRVLIVWEDTYCIKLHLLLKRCVRHLQGPTVEINKDSSNSNSKFDAYIQKSWPKAHRLGLLRSGPIDTLICIADADCASVCCSSSG